MLAAATWTARLVACVLIGVLTFATGAPSGTDLVLEAIGFLVCLSVMGYWLVHELRRAVVRSEPLCVAMGLMAGVGGVLCLAPNAGAFIGFPILACLVAGTDTAWLAGWLVTGIGVLSVEVGALIFSVGSYPVWAYPLLLGLAFITGRNRRAYLVRAEQTAAMAVQLERLRTEQRQVAVLDERNRIAREIHDVLAHSLGALGISLQATRAVLENHDIARAQGLLEQAQRMATDGLVDTRRAVQALRGDTTKLDEQLAALVDVHRERHGTTVGFQLQGDPLPLTPEASVALIRTAQEALVNTAKHAPRQPVDVRLAYSHDQVTLTVSNALGGDPPTLDRAAFTSVDGGYGLVGMRERLLLIHGALTAGPDAHAGWTVLAEVPR